MSYDSGISQIPFTPGCYVNPAYWVANVKAYGATGDGTTDDTAACQCAFSAAPASGGIVYFPPGEYYLSEPIEVGANMTIMGAGASSVLKSLVASEGCKLSVVGDNVTIQGLAFDGGYTSGGQQGDFGLINITDASNVRISDCYLENSGHLAIRIRGGCEDVAIEANTFGNNFCSISSYDISNTRVPQRILISLNSFQANWGTGGETGAIKLQSDPNRSGVTRGHIVSNNIIRNSGQMGIEIWGHASDCAVLGNTITGTEWGISLDDTVRTTVSGNTCRLFTYAGIESATDTAYNVISNNVLDGANAAGTRTANAGIITSNNRPEFIKIIGNHIHGINGSAIKLQTTDDSDIIGNTITNSVNGISLLGVNNITVKTNRLYGPFGTFFFLDCYNQDMSNIDISENVLYGNANDNGITIYDGDGTRNIDGLVMANNNITAATVTNNNIYDNLGNRLTNYIRVGNQFLTDAGSLAWTDGGTNLAPYTPSQQSWAIPVATRWEVTVPTNASSQWFKILSADFGSPIVIYVNLHAFAQGVSNDADNLNVFFGASPYGFGSTGMKLPHARYEDGIVEEVIYDNPTSGPLHEIWVKVKPTTGPYTMGVMISQFPDDAILTPSFVTVEPSWSSNHYKVPCNYAGLTVKTLAITGIPTSSAGLPSGAVWSDGGTLKIV